MSRRRSPAWRGWPTPCCISRRRRRQGSGDERTANLLAALARKRRERCIVYVSTSGVYGNADGARFDETRAVAPATDRACRRVEAESRLRWYGRAFGVRVSVLRVPGIYALDREGGDPRQRVARGSPVLARDDDVYTNHIHADDLARACIAALWRGARQRVYHVNDDSESRMGDHFDRVADLANLPRPPRITREQAAQQLTPLQMSFLGESRRLDNGAPEARASVEAALSDDRRCAGRTRAPFAVAGRQAGS